MTGHVRKTGYKIDKTCLGRLFFHYYEYSYYYRLSFVRNTIIIITLCRFIMLHAVVSVWQFYKSVPYIIYIYITCSNKRCQMMIIKIQKKINKIIIYCLWTLWRGLNRTGDFLKVNSREVYIYLRHSESRYPVSRSIRDDLHTHTHEYNKYILHVVLKTFLFFHWWFEFRLDIISLSSLK